MFGQSDTYHQDAVRRRIHNDLVRPASRGEHPERFMDSARQLIMDAYVKSGLTEEQAQARYTIDRTNAINLASRKGPASA